MMIGFFRNISVRWKLLGGFSLVILMFVAVMVIMIVGQRNTISLNEVQNDRNRDVRLVLELKELIGVIYSDQTDLILNGNGEAIDAVLAKEEQFFAMVNQVIESVANNHSNVRNDQYAQNLQTAASKFMENFYVLIEYYNKRATMTDSELLREYRLIDRESDRHKQIIFTNLELLIKAFDEEFKQAQNDMINTTRSSLFTSVIIGTIAVVIAIGLALLLGYIIGNPLRALTAAAQRVASGDLTGSFPANPYKDEISRLSQSFADMVANLKNLIHQVSGAANDVASSSQELSASAEESAKGSQSVMDAITQVAAGAETQEKAAGETAVAMDEMAAGVQKIAEAASAISEMSLLSAEKARDGGESVRQVVEQMMTIRSAVDHQVEVAERLEYKSKEIGEIIDVIANIAKQTNLLALNAAIEASRAGEHGKGFAVVAAEVRNLAEKSRESAEQISELIAGIQEDIQKAVEAADTGKSEVQRGVETVEKTGESFQDIYNAVEQVAQQVQEMSAIAEQMSAGSEEVAASVTELSNIAKETTRYAQDMSAVSEEQMAIVQQISASAENLSQQAVALQEMIGKFRVE
jgi:methyl-accepting chemotaxis protein